MAEVIDSIFGKFTLEEIETPNCRKCKDKVCSTDPNNCADLVRFIKAIRG